MFPINVPNSFRNEKSGHLSELIYHPAHHGIDVRQRYERGSLETIFVHKNLCRGTVRGEFVVFGAYYEGVRIRAIRVVRTVIRVGCSPDRFVHHRVTASME